MPTLRGLIGPPCELLSSALPHSSALSSVSTFLTLQPSFLRKFKASSYTVGPHRWTSSASTLPDWNFTSGRAPSTPIQKVCPSEGNPNLKQLNFPATVCTVSTPVTVSSTCRGTPCPISSGRVVSVVL